MKPLRGAATIEASAILLLLAFATAGAAMKQDPLTRDSPASIAAKARAVPDTASLEASDRSLRWHSMFTKLPSDWLRFGEVSFASENVLPFLAVGGMTAGLFATDAQSYRAADRFYNGSQMARTWSDIFVEIGDGRSQFGVAGALAIYGIAAGDDHALRASSRVVEAVLGSGLIVQVLKHMTGRESPYVSTRPTGTWRFFPNQITYHKKVPHYDAYPSGHLCTTFATVTVLANEYPDVRWIKPVGYAISGLVAVAMVNTGIHWYSDYPLALAIAYMFGNIVSPPRPDDSTPGQPAMAWKYAPVLTKDRLGMGVRCVF